MNVDDVIATTLVDETARANDVDRHNWGDDRDGMVNMMLMMTMKRTKKVNGRMKVTTLMMMIKEI